MRLYVQKDKANDQVYIGFAADAAKRALARKTVRVSKDIAVDLDARGRLVGVDVMNAGRVLGRQAFVDGLAGDQMVGVAEAAKLCGVRKPNFLRDFASKRAFPKPVAQLAGGTIWLRSDIERFLRARPSAPRLRRIA